MAGIASLSDQKGKKFYASKISFKDYRPNPNNIIDAENYFKESRIEWKSVALDSSLEIRLRGLLGGGCVPSKTKTTQWENHLHNVVVHPKKIISPASLPELVDAFNNSKHIKTGSCYSYNPLCDTEGTLILTHDLNHYANTANPLFGQLMPADLYSHYVNLLQVSEKITPLSEDNPKAFIEVEAGVTIKNLVEYLDTLGLTVYNLGGANVQTLAGAFSTSTHGSGITFGPLHSCVRSLVLCTDSPLFDNEPKQNTYLYRIESYNRASRS